MDKETIEALKKNRTVFNCMDANVISILNELIDIDGPNKSDFQVMSISNSWVETDGKFWGNQTYRLRPDYQESPAIIECKYCGCRDGNHSVADCPIMWKQDRDKAWETIAKLRELLVPA